MQKRRGFKARGKQQFQSRPGGPGPNRPQAGGRRPTRFRGAGNGRHAGPQTCPMCGAVVSDLGGHIRDKHDDAESHPRE